MHVDDIVAVNLHFLDRPQCSGVFNCGTGRAQTFNEVASSVVATMRALRGEPPLSLPQMAEQGLIEYIDFPDALKGKYQSFTQADLGRLRAVGCDVEFMTVQQGVARYVEHLAGRPR